MAHTGLIRLTALGRFCRGGVPYDDEGPIPEPERSGPMNMIKMLTDC